MSQTEKLIEIQEMEIHRLTDELNEQYIEIQELKEENRELRDYIEKCEDKEGC